MTQFISQETLTSMIDVHKRADPYSPYGIGKASYEADAERATHPAVRRAKWLEAAAHWRGLMRDMHNIRRSRWMQGRDWDPNGLDARTYWRAHRFARIALSAAHYVSAA